MKTYTTHRGDLFSLASLNADEIKLVASLHKAVKSKEIHEYFNYFREEVTKFYAAQGMSKREVTEQIVFKIGLDLYSRMLVAAGLARVPDYRDDLEKIVQQKFPTRRAFCEATGLSEDMLSHVLAKRKHLAVDTLEAALAKVGYRLHIVPSVSKAS